MPTKDKQLPARFQSGFLGRLDRRTEVGQRLQAVFDAIVADAGGVDALPRTKLALIERFVFLEAALQQWEREIAADAKAAEQLVGRWIQAVNSLQGLAKLIGLERRVPPVVGLRAYVKERQV